MASANSAGGVMGKMIDAQSIVVASTATQWYGHEGHILRYVFLHSLALAALVGVFVFMIAYVYPLLSWWSIKAGAQSPGHTKTATYGTWQGGPRCPQYRGGMSAIVESSAMIESFRMRAESVSAQVERVATKELAMELVARLLQQEGIEDKPHCYAVWAASAMIGEAERLQLERAVPGLRFDVTRELAADAKVGISQMDWALANTGTLVQSADAVDKRLVSTLPLLHIAMVSTAALLPDLPSVLRRIDPVNRLISHSLPAPAARRHRTVLTIGVHGPERLIIVLVDDLEVAA